MKETMVGSVMSEDRAFSALIEKLLITNAMLYQVLAASSSVSRYSMCVNELVRILVHRDILVETEVDEVQHSSAVFF